MQSWMFLSSYEKLRLKLLANNTLTSMAHLGARGFDSIGGEVVSTTAFVINNIHMAKFKGGYLRLIEGNSEAAKQSDFKEAINRVDCNWRFRASAFEFEHVPGRPIAYWLSTPLLQAFAKSSRIGSIAVASNGVQTGNNERFLRNWFEIDQFKYLEKNQSFCK